MIQLVLAIGNPFCKPNKNNFLNYFCKDLSISKYKTLKLEIIRESPIYFFSIGVDLIWYGRDHAGPAFTINVIGYELSLSIYDLRHWNNKTHNWNQDLESHY